MSYLPNFEYDVFLSYAHKDNEMISKEEEGWMTQFYKQFKLQLDRYLEGTNTAEIWCDHELRKNYVFDDKIKSVIKNSAIFLAFTSNSFYRSEYCQMELSLFHQNSSGSSLGLKVGNYSRLFQIQLLNRHYSLWPKEFQGTDSYNMFKYSNEKSLKKEEDQGITLSSKIDTKLYDESMVAIVQSVCETLQEIKKKSIETPAPPKAQTIFFGNVSHTLTGLRDQIVKELEANGIPVDKCDCPPPHGYHEHKATVSERIQQSKLAIHLFDEIAGEQISRDIKRSFFQEQALIGKELNKEQLIFIQQELDIENINDLGHKQFLFDLSKNKLSNSKYTLIKDFSVPSIIEHINIKLLPPEDPPESDYVLLDFDQVDIQYAVEYYNSIALEKKVYFTTPGKSPIDFINSFDRALACVKAVIIIWYDAAEEWIKQRIKDIICAIKTGKSKISQISIYKDERLSDLDINTLSVFI